MNEGRYVALAGFRCAPLSIIDCPTGINCLTTYLDDLIVLSAFTLKRGTCTTIYFALGSSEAVTRVDDS